MSIILENYEIITKTIVNNIRNGKIISYNSDRLEGLTKKELFKDFVNHFNFSHYSNVITSPEIITDNILKIHFEHKVSAILGIYFQGIGELILDDISPNDLSSGNDLYLDLNTLNINSQWITQSSVISLNYIGYNELYEEII